MSLYWCGATTISPPPSSLLLPLSSPKQPLIFLSPLPPSLLPTRPEKTAAGERCTYIHTHTTTRPRPRIDCVRGLGGSSGGAGRRRRRRSERGQRRGQPPLVSTGVSVLSALSTIILAPPPSLLSNTGTIPSNLPPPPTILPFPNITLPPSLVYHSYVVCAPTIVPSPPPSP